MEASVEALPASTSRETCLPRAQARIWQFIFGGTPSEKMTYTTCARDGVSAFLLECWPVRAPQEIPSKP